ncbi:hypothetical protein [Filifactor alocis]|uniref:hypothetical protein n=1 Tax=Filifactor alocis TaxID=143361 RepID=UPI003FA0F322
MLVKSILGAIKYDGIVYGEGQEFEIKEEHFKSLQDNVVVVKSEETEGTTDETTGTETETETEKDGKIDFTSWTVEELRKFAKDADVPLKSGLTKAEIVAILEKEEFKVD